MMEIAENQKQPLVELLLSVADDKLLLGHRNSDWTGLAPMLEENPLFGAIADRIVPAAQVRDLWEHWDQPRIEWYPGAHVTFRAHPGVSELIHDGLRELTVTA